MSVITENVGTEGVGCNTLFRNSTDRVELAQGFTLPSDAKIDKARIRIYKQGSPTGNVWLEIRTNNAGNPSTTVLATSTTKDVTTLGTSAPGDVVELVFESEPDLTGATQYHLVYVSDVALSGTHNLVVSGGPSGNTYAGGVAKKKNATVWSDFTDPVFDFYFSIDKFDTLSVEYEGEGGAKGSGVTEPEASFDVPAVGGAEGSGVGQPATTVQSSMAGGAHGAGEAALEATFEALAAGGAQGAGAAGLEAQFELGGTGGAAGSGTSTPSQAWSHEATGGLRAGGTAKVVVFARVDIILYEPEGLDTDIILRPVASPAIVISGSGAIDGTSGDIDGTGVVPVVIVPVPIPPVNIPGGGSWIWEKVEPKPKRRKRVFITPRRGRATLVSVAGDTRGYGKIDTSRLIERDLAMLAELDDMLDKIGAR